MAHKSERKTIMKSGTNNKLAMALCITTVLFLSTSSVVFAQAPDNAALLYYQAFLMYEKPDETLDKMLSDFRGGKIKANEEIKQHIEKNRQIVDLIVKAANIQNCNWGYDYSQGLELKMTNLAQMRRVTYLIQAEAKLLSEQSDYRTALDRCLSMHKMALHSADSTFIGYLVAIALGRQANNSIQGILADIPEDLQTLDWFRNQLAEIDSRPSLLKDAINVENKVLGTYMTKEKFNELLSNKDLGVEASLLKTAQERFLAADEQFFVRNRDYWQNHFAAVKAALDLPYAQAFAELKRIEEKVKTDVIENPDATGTAILAAPFARIVSQQVAAKTFYNAIRTAVEIYLINARSGRLPDKLPAGLPKDLFSDKDFEYEKTDNSFVLRCQGKDLSEGKIHQYEFKVKK
jgi:hypothetical protein